MATQRNKASNEELLQALNALEPDQLQAIMQRAGLAPTTVGMSPDQLKTILQTVGQTNAQAMQKSLQRENDKFPNQSVFDPTGRFDAEGNQLPPKVTFKYTTFFIGVRMGDQGGTSDLCTPEEIELFNRFTVDKEARSGRWQAKFTNRDGKRLLSITLPVRSVDDRMGLPDLSSILLELLEGPDAVNPATLVAKVKTQDEELAALRARLNALENVPEPEHASV